MALAELRRQLEAWERHEPGARLGADPEELHQLRVAVRRIDAILGLFKQQLPAELVRARRAAKGILRTLGAARDFDVQLAELDRYCESLSAAERLAAAPLRARLEADRAQARVHMIRVLDSDATRQWLESLRLGERQFLGRNPAGRCAGRDRHAGACAEALPQAAQGRAQSATRESAMEKYHVVRRRAKLLRYALEPGAELFGKPAEEMLRALRRLQDGLGEHQDAHLAKNRLEALAADASAGLPAETLFLMGRLAEHHLKRDHQGTQDPYPRLEEGPRQALEDIARENGSSQRRSAGLRTAPRQRRHEPPRRPRHPRTCSPNQSPPRRRARCGTDGGPMDLLIVRHAIAMERDAKRWPDDRLRPLSARGIARGSKAAAGLGA